MDGEKSPPARNLWKDNQNIVSLCQCSSYCSNAIKVTMKTWNISKLSRHLWFYSVLPQNMEGMSCPCVWNPLDLNLIFKWFFSTYRNTKYMSSEILPIKKSTRVNWFIALWQPRRYFSENSWWRTKNCSQGKGGSTAGTMKVYDHLVPISFAVDWIDSKGDLSEKCTENADNLIGRSICIGGAIDSTICQIFLKVN